MNTIKLLDPLRRMALLLGALALSACALGAEPATVIPAPTVDNPKVAGPTQTAVLAGGCFWGVQGVYQHVRGVKKVLSGYAGGDKSTAQYRTVGTGRTGQAQRRCSHENHQNPLHVRPPPGKC